MMIYKKWWFWVILIIIVIPVSPKPCGYKYNCGGVQFYEKNLGSENEVKLCSGFCFMEKSDEPEESLEVNEDEDISQGGNAASSALGGFQEKMPLIIGAFILIGLLIVLQNFMKQLKGV